MKNMNTKMHFATQTITVAFVVNDNLSQREIYNYARKYLKQEESHRDPSTIEIKEIHSLDELPKNWWETIYYGENPDDQYPVHYLKDEEYKTYLRLKEKFEDD